MRLIVRRLEVILKSRNPRLYPCNLRGGPALPLALAGKLLEISRVRDRELAPAITDQPPVLEFASVHR